MTEQSAFQGFPKQALQFLHGLRDHNSKLWFEQHKAEYEATIMVPSRAFVVEMGRRLKTISPGIIAVPQVNGSLFRINRDTRFSKDKSPYKTNIGIFFWEGQGTRMECSGFYVHLEPEALMIGAGIYMFPQPLLERYRKAVVDPHMGAALAEAVRTVDPEAFGPSACAPGVERYKKVPAGYDASHPNAELLRNKGLTAGFESTPPPELHGPELVPYCLERFKHLAPIHHWLIALTAWTG
jgi:uncharacterized protein (TIGR02453 family)